MWDTYIDKEDKSPYADYVGFEKWMNQISDTPQQKDNQFCSVWHTLDTLERIGLYSIMVDILVHGKDVGWTEEEKSRKGRND